MERANPLQASREDLAKIGAGAGVFGLGEILFNLLRYASSLIITRFAGSAVFGTLSIAMTLTAVGRILSKAGMDHGLVRFLSLYRSRSDLSRFKGTLFFALRVGLVLGSLAGVALFLLSWSIHSRFFPKIDHLGYTLRWLAITLPLSTLLLLILSALQGIQNIKGRVLVEKILQPLFRVALLLILFAAGLRLEGILITVVINYFLCLGLAACLFKKSVPPLAGIEKTVENPREMFAFCLPLTLEGFLNFLMRSIDILMLGFILGSASAVGIYSAAALLAPAVVLPLAAINMMFAPLVSEIHGRNEKGRLNSLFKTVTGWAISSSLPIFGVFFLFPSFLMGLFGEKFVEGAICLAVLGLGEFINAAVGPVGYFLMMTGRPRINLVNSLLMCAINFGLNILLIPRYGLVGAAAATGSSIALINLLRLVEVFVIYRVHPFRRSALKPFVAFLAAAFAIQALRYIGFHGSALFAVLGILIFLGIYSGLLLMMGFLREYEVILDKLLARRAGT